MGGPADRFAADTDAFSNVRHAESGEYLHEYTGVLAATSERVRIVTLAPALTDIDAAVDAFSRMSDQWYNASANATIRSIRDRGTEPRPWIAVPDHGGDTLATVHDELSPEGVQTVITETADALRTLGLYNTVHGHLSPDDITLLDATDTPSNPTVLLGGFGLEAAIRTAVGEFELTAYTAPELLDNPDRPTQQTDVYGLAAVTYFALTGRPPIEGDDFDQAIRDGPSSPPSAHDDAIPAALDDIVMRGLATHPDDRYGSPYAFGRAFLSTFEPAVFSPDDTADGDDDEAETTDDTVDSSESADAEPDGTEAAADTVDSAEPDDAVPAADDDSAPSDGGHTSAASGDTDESGVTRRVAVGLLGVGALAGGGWFLSRGQLTSTEPREPTATPEPPAEPSASISVTPTAPAVGQEVTFSAAASTTGEGVSVETYEWAVGDNAAFVEGAATRTHSFTESGEQIVQLQLTDSRGRTATATATVTVERTADGAPMFRYDAANTGTDTDETGPQTRVSERWSYETGDSVSSSPAVVDGTVYVGSEDGSVYALSAETGSEQWAYETGSAIHSSPAVVDDTVYVGSEDGTVYALSADDGTEQWSYETSRAVRSSPAVVDDTVYVGSDDSSVYALSADDGTEQWSFETGDNVLSSPAVVDGTVYVGSVDGYVYALSADDGTEQWSYETVRTVRSSPAVVDGTVYVGCRDFIVYALSAADGAERWEYSAIGPVRSSPAVVDGTVYVGSGQEVYALSAEGPGLQWRQWTRNQVRSSPAVIDGTVYVGSDDGNVYALSADDGAEQWSYETGDSVFSSPTVVDDAVYVGSDDGYVYALSEQ